MSVDRKAPIYSLPDALRGLLIYGVGDGVAAWLTGQFQLSRLLGIMVIGSTVYAMEIPHYFRWIDRQSPARPGWRASIPRTLLALLYFNPLWIARHLLFIRCFSGQWEAVSTDLLRLGASAFLANIPFAFLANYLIQNQLPSDWRFPSSAVFSALMAIYYASSEVLFG